MISHILRNQIDEYVITVRQSALLERARAGQVTPAIVGRYLASIHHLLTQTPIHLALAKEQAMKRGQEELFRYFDQKLHEEEAHHHWAASDREHLREFFGEPALQEPSTKIFALTRNTRAIIERDPHLYLAYILFAEYFTVVIGPEWIATLDEHCGIPVSALTAVSRHVELDKHHVVEACEEMDALVEGVHFHEPMRQALRETMAHFTDFCDDLCGLAA